MILNSFLLGVDGHVYQGDPEIVASQINERTLSSTASSSSRLGGGSVFKTPHGAAGSPVVHRRSSSSLQELSDGALPDIGG